MKKEKRKIISQKNLFEQAVRLYDGDYFNAKTKFENILKKTKMTRFVMCITICATKKLNWKNINLM